jgi:hypothetical protein
MKRKQKFFIIFDFFLSSSYVFLKIYKKIRGLYFFQPFFDSHMFFYQVLDGFICILNFFLTCLDFLRAWAFWVRGRGDPPAVYNWDTFLLKRLLVHFVDKEVNIFTHFFELIAKLFVFSLEKLLFFGVIT